jgi:hypothetical protein
MSLEIVRSAGSHMARHSARSATERGYLSWTAQYVSVHFAKAMACGFAARSQTVPKRHVDTTAE